MKIVICNECASSVRFPISDVSVAHIVICLFSIFLLCCIFVLSYFNFILLCICFSLSDLLLPVGRSVMAESAHSARKNVILIRIISRHEKHARSRSFFSYCFYRIVLKCQNTKVKKKRSNKHAL
jgi:hypothetical protein